MNAQSGEPLGKVEVRLFSGRSSGGDSPSVFTARTTADGAFSLESIPAGEYLFAVTRRAFATGSAELRGIPGARPQGRGWTLSVRAGQALKGVEIRMPPAAVVTGQVYDEEGEPMTGVVIEAEQYRYVQGVKALVAVGRSTADDRGIYRIYDLSPGRYFIKAQGRSLRSRLGAAGRGGFLPGMAGPGGGRGPGGGPGGQPGGGFGGGGALLAALEESVAYPETYYPNARAATEAVPLQLTPGAEMGGIDFTLVPSPTYSVSGRVSGVAAPAGATEQAMVLVTARPADQPGLLGDASGLTPANPRTGEFVLRNLMPGNYTLIARTNSRRGGSTSVGVAQVTVGNGSVNDVAIAVAEDVTVPGKVSLPNGFTTTQLSRMSIVPERRLLPGRSIARADANGVFSLTLSRAEAPRFAFNNIPEGTYVKRVVLGGVDVLTEGASLTIGGAMTVELAADGASLSGYLKDSRGTAIANGRVSLIPAASFNNPDSAARSVWRKTATTQDDGTFQFTAIAPGRYRLYAFENLDADPSFDADFLSNFGQRWKEVELEARESLSVEMNPIPATDTAMYLGESQ